MNIKKAINHSYPTMDRKDWQALDVLKDLAREFVEACEQQGIALDGDELLGPATIEMLLTHTRNNAKLLGAIDAETHLRNGYAVVVPSFVPQTHRVYGPFAEIEYARTFIEKNDLEKAEILPFGKGS
jgi:hypothetical protein